MGHKTGEVGLATPPQREGGGEGGGTLSRGGLRKDNIPVNVWTFAILVQRLCQRQPTTPELGDEHFEPVLPRTTHGDSENIKHLVPSKSVYNLGTQRGDFVIVRNLSRAQEQLFNIPSDGHCILVHVGGQPRPLRLSDVRPVLLHTLVSRPAVVLSFALLCCCSKVLTSTFLCGPRGLSAQEGSFEFVACLRYHCLRLVSVVPRQIDALPGPAKLDACPRQANALLQHSLCSCSIWEYYDGDAGLSVLLHSTALDFVLRYSGGLGCLALHELCEVHQAEELRCSIQHSHHSLPLLCCWRCLGSRLGPCWGSDGGSPSKRKCSWPIRSVGCVG
eukprot:Sspe_Gene.34305::Locus_16694_Transcript_1_1_Confidence_1.000_Length_2695::g.34305::m.34305